MAVNIVTIGREYGSGGRLIGRKVAEQLGYDFYDKDIIKLVAAESGFALEFVEETGEYAAGGYDVTAFGIAHSFAPAGLSPADQVNVIQSRVIREIAQKGRCVIVGRAADHILKDRGDVLNVFVYADPAVRQQRAVQFYGLAASKASKAIQKKDKQRAGHYGRYTGKTWGLARNYTLCLDSGALGIDRSAALVALAAE